MRQYGLPDGPEQMARDQMYARSLLEVTKCTKDLVVPPEPDMNAAYGSPGFSAWVYTYDTEQVLREYFGEGPKRVRF